MTARPRYDRLRALGSQPAAHASPTSKSNSLMTVVYDEWKVCHAPEIVFKFVCVFLAAAAADLLSRVLTTAAFQQGGIS